MESGERQRRSGRPREDAPEAFDIADVKVPKPGETMVVPNRDKSGEGEPSARAPSGERFRD